MIGKDEVRKDMKEHRNTEAITTNSSPKMASKQKEKEGNFETQQSQESQNTQRE